LYVLFPIDRPTGTTSEILLNFRELVSFFRIPLDSPDVESVVVSRNRELFCITSVDCPVMLEIPATRLTLPPNGKSHCEVSMVRFLFPPEGDQELLKKYQDVVCVPAVPFER